MTNKDKKMLLICMPATMHKAVKKEAKRQDRSIAALIRMMIKNTLQLN